ncbi:MAG: iron-containing redox enzyme family protein [Myxococcota bacterium]
MSSMSLEVLEAIPRAMAAAIAPVFVQPTRDRYVRYLSAMVHYTRESRAELEHAASSMPTEELRTLFLQLAREEATHYRLAEADLEALGEAIDSTVPKEVLAIRLFWMTIPPGQPFQFLGALFALENVARELALGAEALLERLGLEASHTRFIVAHLSTDDDHGAAIGAACRQYWEAEAPSILAGAERASERWVAMHLELLDE